MEIIDYNIICMPYVLQLSVFFDANLVGHVSQTTKKTDLNLVNFYLFHNYTKRQSLIITHASYVQSFVLGM